MTRKIYIPSIVAVVLIHLFLCYAILRNQPGLSLFRFELLIVPNIIASGLFFFLSYERSKNAGRGKVLAILMLLFWLFPPVWIGSFYLMCVAPLDSSNKLKDDIAEQGIQVPRRTIWSRPVFRWFVYQAICLFSIVLLVNGGYEDFPDEVLRYDLGMPRSISYLLHILFWIFYCTFPIVWVWRKPFINHLLGIISFLNRSAEGNDVNVNSTTKNSKTIYPSLEDENKDKAENKSQINYFEKK